MAQSWLYFPPALARSDVCSARAMPSVSGYVSSSRAVFRACHRLASRLAGAPRGAGSRRGYAALPLAQLVQRAGLLPAYPALSLCDSRVSPRKPRIDLSHFLSRKTPLGRAPSATDVREIRIPGLLQGRFGAYQKPCRCHTAPPPAPTGGRVRGARRRSTDTRLASGRAESTAKRKAQYRTSIHATRRYMRDKRATGADRVRRAAHTASAPNHIPQSEAGYAWPPQTRPNFATSSPARSSQVWRRI